MAEESLSAEREACEDDNLAVIVIDGAGGIVHVDDVAQTRLGRGISALSGVLVGDVFRGLIREHETVEVVARVRRPRMCSVRVGEHELAFDVVLRRLFGTNEERFLATFAPVFDAEGMFGDTFARGILDTMDSIVAVLDTEGIIVYTNESWRAFMLENGGDPKACGIGANYVRVSEGSIGSAAEEGSRVADALRRIMGGTLETFHLSYPCHSPTQVRWFQVRGRAFHYRGKKFVILTHERIDELKRSEEELREHQVRSEDAAHLANFGHFHRNLDQSPELVFSPDAGRILGLDAANLRMSVDTFFQHVHSEDRARFQNMVRTAFVGTSTIEVDYRIVRPDGATRWIRSIARRTLNKNNEPVNTFGVLQDVTPYRVAIDDLEHNQALFRTIFELAQDGIAVIDLEGKIRMVNPRFEEIFNNGAGAMVGHSVYDFMEPRSAVAVRQRYAARLRGEFVEPVVTMELRNGKQCTVRSSLGQIRNTEGEAKGAILFATDLTAIIDTQNALDLTLARFQRALELTHALVSDQDTALRFVRVYNGHFYKDPIGKRDDELLPIDYAKNIVRIKQSVLDTGRPAREDVAVLRGDILSHFDLCVEPLLDSEGRTSGITCVAIDITERVRAQVARQEHNERMYAELEAKNQALEAARLDADHANVAKSRFLAMMSHEIRTPLNGILGMTGVLLDSLEDSAQREIVETIRTSGDALLTIINDILDFSKIEAGLMDLEEQPFVLRHCLDDVIDLIGPQARKKFIEIGFLVDPAVPAGIFGDITRLRQVLVNLVGNALKFTDSGEVVVEVKPGRGAPSGKFLLHVSVRDTGIGIAAERMGRLFQTFSQVDASINRKYGGTGLGLAICKRLVELMGGRIWVESTPGEGTTFHFTIPTVAAPGIKSDLIDAITAARLEFEGRRVLLVDDNAVVRRILAEQIQSLGLDPVVVSSGAEAWGILESLTAGEGDIRTAVMMAMFDLEMPEMSGYQLLNMVRSDARFMELPVVLLTASDAAPSQIKKQYHAPCLSKPVKQSTLFEAVARSVLQSPNISSRGPRSIPIDSTLGRRCPLRILLAEDNVINQKVALLLLQRAGYRADIAANGQEVLDAVVKKAYDLILMDVQMPEMDGLEATKRLRGPGPWLGKPRIVAMTADVMREGREACTAAGMDDFVAKPIRVHELMRMLERIALAVGERAREDVWTPGTEAPLQTTEEIVIDEGAFASLRDVCALDGEDSLSALVHDFNADSRRMLAELKELLAKGEYFPGERVAHTLKGTAGTFGANGLSRIMAQVEQAAKDHDAAEMNRLVDAATIEHARVVVALEALCFGTESSENS